MPYDFSSLRERIRETKEWLAGEYAGVHTGRATPAILDGVRVDSYGAKVPVPHLAGIITEDAKTLRVTPWDKNQIKEMERAINDSDVGVSVNTDGEGLRVIFPELTSERRAALSRLVGAKHEEARISLRQARDESWDEIRRKHKGGELSEDEKFRLKDELQRMTDEANKELDAMKERKIAELSS